MSLVSSAAVERNKERNNVMDGETPPSDGRGKRHVTDEDNHVYLGMRENMKAYLARLLHSSGINKIITSTGRQG